MRTKTISRWRKAALCTAAAASLTLPARAQDANAPAPQPTENSQIPATQAPPPPPPAPAPGDSGPTQVYTIQKGDTLWDLSQKFLANPWYWPKIWSLNPYIENPHWIYPGQKLQIKPGAGGAPAQVEGPAEAAPGTEQAAQPGVVNPDAAGEAETQIGVDGSPGEAAASQQVVTSTGRLAFKPPPVMTVHAPGLVGQQEIDNAGVLDASFEEKEMLSISDSAYVRFKGDANVHVGDRMLVFRVDGDVTNHKTGQKVAVRTKTVGDAKVIAITGTVTVVQITGEREEIVRGDLVRPWVDDSRRLAATPNTTQLDGTILGNSTEPTVEELGVGNQVYIDKGAKDGVVQGNTFLVVTQGDGLGTTGSQFISYTQGEQGSRPERRDDPDEAIGMLLVIDVRDNISTAVIIRSIRELEAGDRVQMRTGG